MFPSTLSFAIKPAPPLNDTFAPFGALPSTVISGSAGRTGGTVSGFLIICVVLPQLFTASQAVHVRVVSPTGISVPVKSSEIVTRIVESSSTSGVGIQFV